MYIQTQTDMQAIYSSHLSKKNEAKKLEKQQKALADGKPTTGTADDSSSSGSSSSSSDSENEADIEPPVVPSTTGAPAGENAAAGAAASDAPSIEIAAEGAAATGRPRASSSASSGTPTSDGMNTPTGHDTQAQLQDPAIPATTKATLPVDYAKLEAGLQAAFAIPACTDGSDRAEVPEVVGIAGDDQKQQGNNGDLTKAGGPGDAAGGKQVSEIAAAPPAFSTEGACTPTPGCSTTPTATLPVGNTTLEAELQAAAIPARTDGSDRAKVPEVLGGAGDDPTAAKQQDDGDLERKDGSADPEPMVLGVAGDGQEPQENNGDLAKAGGPGDAAEPEVLGGAGDDPTAANQEVDGDLERKDGSADPEPMVLGVAGDGQEPQKNNGDLTKAGGSGDAAERSVLGVAGDDQKQQENNGDLTKAGGSGDAAEPRVLSVAGDDQKQQGNNGDLTKAGGPGDAAGGKQVSEIAAAPLAFSTEGASTPTLGCSTTPTADLPVGNTTLEAELQAAAIPARTDGSDSAKVPEVLGGAGDDPRAATQQNDGDLEKERLHTAVLSSPTPARSDSGADRKKHEETTFEHKVKHDEGLK